MADAGDGLLALDVYKRQVLTHLDPGKYEPVPLGITRDGRWFLYRGPFDALLDDSWHTDERHLIPAVISPDRGVHGLLLIAPAGPSTCLLYTSRCV